MSQLELFGSTYSPERATDNIAMEEPDTDAIEPPIRAPVGWGASETPPDNSSLGEFDPFAELSEFSPEFIQRRAMSSWRLTRYRMRLRGVRGNDHIVRLLSLMGSSPYRGGGPRVRALLTAPPSAGKTFLLSAFATATGLPFVQVDASALSPEGWNGPGVSDVMTSAYEKCGRRMSLMQDGVVLVLDEIDKAVRRTRDDRYGSVVRRDRQAALLQLIWGGTPIRFGHASQYDLECRTDRWIVVACGAFADSAFGRERRQPTQAELIEYGFIPELASRFTTHLVMPPRSVDDVLEILRSDGDGIPAISRVCAAFGFPLNVTEAALRHVAAAVASERNGLTLRAGMHLLVDACNAALLEAMEERLPADTPLLITPDDVPLGLANPSGERRRYRDEGYA